MKPLASVAAAAAMLLPGSAARAQVPLVQVPTLSDIAMTTMQPTGPVIFYNPITCQQMGPDLCGFFITHEYGHIATNSAFDTQPDREAKADCWAARNAPPEQVDAAIRYFLSGMWPGHPWYGTPMERAQRLQACRG